jgi:UDP-N-acetyl-2-amino-2-deoxyglucuronate dehydrogenase
MGQTNFVLIGAAGYIAPRHMQAIKAIGGNLIAATDPHDSVGVLDKYYDDVAYFKEFERFDRHIDKLNNDGVKIDYVVVCSPNYLHDAHIRFGTRIGARVICEKPLVICPKNCDLLIEKYSNINAILQLRLHPAIARLKHELDNSKHRVDLTYITPRGPWYLYSWKGSPEQSGGLIMNIGIHFFDMLIWLFGAVEAYSVTKYTKIDASGVLELERASVNWFLSINRDMLPIGAATFRSMTIDGESVEFSGGFTDLHTQSYKEILSGNGFGPVDARPSIQLAYDIRCCGERL